MSHILLTRPQTLVKDTATKIEALGHTVSIIPTSNPIAVEHPPHETTNYIVSSRHGVNLGLSMVSNKGARVFAVGEKAGAAASEAGFADVVVVSDADALLAVIEKSFSPEDGAITHLCGAHISTNICAALTRDGYDATANVVYEATALPLDDKGMLDAFKNGDVDCVLFYSARAVTIFEGWVKEAGAATGFKHCKAVVMSRRIEAALSPNWIKTAVAEAPNEKSLFKAAGL